MSRKYIKIFHVAFGMLTGFLSYPIAWFLASRPKDDLSKAIADILLLGFYGSNSHSPSARLLAHQLEHGQVNAVFFVNQNIGTRKDVESLVHLFRRSGNNPLLAIDHEGGIVQRLTSSHGFTTIPSPKEIAQKNLLLDEVVNLYTQAGKEMATIGFNINLGPVVDIHEPNNEAIGIHGRSFGTEVNQICTYAIAFVTGFRSANILCTLKHFPGHGRSIGDSHDHAANISHSWKKEELEPFSKLIKTGHAPMIMCGHLLHEGLENTGVPATLSSNVINGLLRTNLSYTGVVVTDDLDMGAISHLFSRRQALIKAIAAGNDLLMIKNLFGYDPLLPHRAVTWIRQAIARGELDESQVFEAAKRIRNLRLQAHLSNSN